MILKTKPNLMKLLQRLADGGIVALNFFCVDLWRSVKWQCCRNQVNGGRLIEPNNLSLVALTKA